MLYSIQLLNQSLPISVEPGAEGGAETVMSVIQDAVSQLNAQFAAGRLGSTAIQYIGALQGLGVALNRGFTPCKGTQDADVAEYVFFIGAADVAVNADPLWYASTIIHDGGHAWLDQQNQTATGVTVEQALTQVQIDYFAELGSRPTYMENLPAYIADPAAIQARIAHDTGLQQDA